MEEVFDFREFMLLLLKKCRLVLILALIFALLGAGFGFLTGGREQYKTTSGVSVSIVASASETAPLTDTMNNLNAIVSDDYFFTGLVGAVKKAITPEQFDRLLHGKRNPKLSDLKEVFRLSVKGNLVLVEVTASDPALAASASHEGREYLKERLPSLNPNVVLSDQAEQTVNLNEQQGGGRWDKTLKFGLLGLGGGVVVGILWVFFVGVFSLKVKSSDELRKYGLSILWEGESSPSGYQKAAIRIAAAARPIASGSTGPHAPFIFLLTSSNPEADCHAAADGLLAGFGAIRVKAAVLDLPKRTLKTAEVAKVLEDLPERPSMKECEELLWSLANSYDASIVLAPCLSDSELAMLVASTCGNVVFAEQVKQSRTDAIDRALSAARSLEAKSLGFLLTP